MAANRMIRDLARTQKTAAATAQRGVPSTWSGTVAAVSGDEVSVILDADTSLAARAVTDNAAGPCLVGDEVLLVKQGRDLLIVANRTAAARVRSDADALAASVAALQAALANPAQETDTGWVAVPLSAGFTGQAWVRRVGVMVELWASVTGTIPEGNTGFAICPEGFRPTGEDARFGAYFSGAYQGVGYVTAGGTVGVTQRTGTQAGVRARGNWLLN